MLRGHVGEWHVREHLMDASIEVAMPAASNAPGLDLWADGHAVNVKIVEDAASAASSHFSRYPDIPIIVPGDAAHIPADALHFDPSSGLDTAALAGSDHLVLVDDALSRADVLDQTNHALEVRGDPGPHLHFPWVTAAVSGFREARLLVKGHTDIARAAKNVLVDTAAVGGGVAIGAKAGALLGTAFGPVGTVIGGLAGLILGAAGGRAAANAVKKAPLEAAKAQYDAALLQYREVEAALAEDAGARWEQVRTEERAPLAQQLSRLERDFATDLEALERSLSGVVRLELDAARGLLADARTRIEAAYEADRAALRARSPRALWPWAALVAPEAAQRYVQHRRERAAWIRAADALTTAWTGSDANTTRCFDLVLAAPGGVAEAEAHLQRSEERRKAIVLEAGKQHQTLLARAAEHRRAAVARLQRRWTDIQCSVEEALAPVVSSLRLAGDQLRSELRKNGIVA